MKNYKPWFIILSHNLTGTSFNLSLIVFFFVVVFFVGAWLTTASEISHLDSGFKSYSCKLNALSTVLVKARFPLSAATYLCCCPFLTGTTLSNQSYFVFHKMLKTKSYISITLAHSYY